MWYFISFMTCHKNYILFWMPLMPLQNIFQNNLNFNLEVMFEFTFFHFLVHGQWHWPNFLGFVAWFSFLFLYWHSFYSVWRLTNSKKPSVFKVSLQFFKVKAEKFSEQTRYSSLKMTLKLYCRSHTIYTLKQGLVYGV